MTLSNPLNLLLIPPILYLAFRIVFPSHPPSTKVVPGEYDADVYNWMPAKHPEVIVHRKYTASELAELDGKGGGRILLAIMRVGRDGKVSKGLERTVFDVSNGRSFYGPGESAHAHNRDQKES
jgi:membrane-associated progesterone receptor component